MNLALLIASILGAAIQGVPQIPAAIKTIVSSIAAALSALLTSGVTTSLNPTTVLSALSGVIQQLKSIPQIPAATLEIISGLEDAIAAALAADQKAQQGVDPAQLLPVTTLP